MDISSADLSAEAEQALRQWPWILATEAAHQLPRLLLVAVGSRETNLTDETGDGGHGRGVWQLDDRSHQIPDPFPVAQQADIAAGMLQGLLRATGNLKCACAAYNEGLGNEEAAVAHGPAHDPDLYTTGHDYGTDVLGRLTWLQQNLPATAAPADDQEELMAISKTPMDEARGWTRLVFEIATNDEPTPDQLTAIANVGVNSGFEALVTQVLDSPQGQKRRAARDAAQGG